MEQLHDCSVTYSLFPTENQYVQHVKRGAYYAVDDPFWSFVLLIVVVITGTVMLFYMKQNDYRAFHFTAQYRTEMPELYFCYLVLQGLDQQCNAN